MKAKTALDVKTNKKVLITEQNYLKIKNTYDLPLSTIRRYIGLRPFVFLPYQRQYVAFFDIEIDKQQEFVCGVVNNKVFYDVDKLLDELAKYKVWVGYNIVRFDLRYLASLRPERFITYNNRAIEIYKFKKVTVADAFPAYRLIATDRVTSRSLAKFLGMDLNCDYNSDPVEKCKEDVQVLMKFYPIMRNILNFFEYNFDIDCEELSACSIKQTQKLRRQVFQSFFLKHYGELYPPSNTYKNYSEQPNVLIFSKRGIYKNIYYYDISNAYPTALVNLDNETTTLFKPADIKEFYKYMIKLREQSTAEYMKTLIKAIMLKLIGDFGSKSKKVQTYSKRDLMVKIWNKVYETMRILFDKYEKHIICAYVDGLFSKKPFEEFKNTDTINLNGFTMKFKGIYDYVVIYNDQKRLLVDLKHKIVDFKHKSTNLPNLKIFEVLDEKMKEVLLKGNTQIIRKPATILEKIKLENYDALYYSLLLEVPKAKKKKVNGEEVEVYEINDPRLKYPELEHKLKEGWNAVYVAGYESGHVKFDTEIKNLDLDACYKICVDYLNKVYKL